MQDFGKRPQGQRRVALLVFERNYGARAEAPIPGPDCRSAEIWGFDDAQGRHRTELRLAARGLRVQYRSALKPLVCAFRDEIPTASLEQAQITYPRHPAAPANRFLLEAYPLTGMFPAVAFGFAPGPETSELPLYRLRLRYAGGKERRLTVLAPNALGDDGALSPCGWIVGDGRAARLATTYETLFHDVMAAIRAMDCPAPPCFEELNITVTMPVRDERLGWGDEALSLREALHEDLYFGILDHFRQRFGLPEGDRSLQPGQIVPEIRHGPEWSARVELRPWDLGPPAQLVQPLARARQALSPAQIRDELARLPGRGFGARSVAGRPVEARYKPGSDRAVMISAGQHANEVRARSAPCAPGRNWASLRAPISPCARWKTPMAMPCSSACRRTIRATCCTRRAIPPWATIWSIAPARPWPKRRSAIWRRAFPGRSCMSACTAIRRMNGCGR